MTYRPKHDKAEAAALVSQLTDEQVALLARQDIPSLGRVVAAARRRVASSRPQIIPAPRPRVGILALKRD